MTDSSRRRRRQAAEVLHGQEGSDLSKIAQEVYGKASKYPVIFEANKPMLAPSGRSARPVAAHTGLAEA